MKIGLFGNMNNSFFAITRYLQDRGYQPDLYLMGEELDHFHPKADSFTDDYKQYTQQLSWTKYPSRLIQTSKSAILSDVGKYDFTLGCDVAPAYFAKANHPMDVYGPYGRDLYKLPFFRKYYSLSRSGLSKSWRYWYFCNRQKTGIKKAETFLMGYTNKEFEKILDELNISPQKRINLPLPFIYLPEYSDENVKAYENILPNYQKALRLREANDYLFLHHCRHTWVSNKGTWGDKGNDRILIGFRDFLQKTKSKAHLILFEYGKDVDASKKLIEDLGIQSHVTWFPLMPRKEIMAIIKLIDFGIGQLIISWITYGAIIEIMSMGKPIMHNRDDSLYDPEMVKNFYPMVRAVTAEDITRGLMNFIEDPESHREMGRQSKAWVEENLINKPLDTICELIERKKRTS